MQILGMEVTEIHVYPEIIGGAALPSEASQTVDLGSDEDQYWITMSDAVTLIPSGSLQADAVFTQPGLYQIGLVVTQTGTNNVIGTDTKTIRVHSYEKDQLYVSTISDPEPEIILLVDDCFGRNWLMRHNGILTAWRVLPDRLHSNIRIGRKRKSISINPASTRFRSQAAARTL